MKNFVRPGGFWLTAALLMWAVDAPLMADSGHPHGHDPKAPSHAGGDHPGGEHHALDAAVIGKPGGTTEVDRTITLEATDNRFDKQALRIKQGETIRFVIHNKGKLLHEFNIGTKEMHIAHQEQMRAMMGDASQGDGHAHHAHGAGHDEPNVVMVQPGDSRELIWRFSGSGVLEFACNIPGHYESGMHGQFRIE